jgi:Tol biopolymer transport system component
VTGTIEGISTGGDTGGFEGESFLSSISADGRFVGFTSADSFDGDVHPFVTDALVFDRLLGTTSIVNRNSVGVQADEESETPFVSEDGTWVVFSSRATNLVADDTNGMYDVFRRNLVTGVTGSLLVTATQGPTRSAAA